MADPPNLVWNHCSAATHRTNSSSDSESALQVIHLFTHELGIPADRNENCGRHIVEGCGACGRAWEYDTQPLEDLFRARRPQNGRKGRFFLYFYSQIKPLLLLLLLLYLAHYAWVDSSGRKFVRKDDCPGWLRAHEIVERHRFARPQAWSVPVSHSGCVLRKGASRCP